MRSPVYLVPIAVSDKSYLIITAEDGQRQEQDFVIGKGYLAKTDVMIYISGYCTFFWAK